MLEQDYSHSSFWRQDPGRRNAISLATPVTGRGVAAWTQDVRVPIKVDVLIEQPLAIPMDFDRFHTVVEVIILEICILLAHKERSSMIISFIIGSQVTATCPAGSGKKNAVIF